MGHHPVVVAEAAAELKASGVGAGGTRNISGTHPGIIALERAIAKAIGKACALVFTSGYVANETALQVLGRMLPGVVILSDEKNHASMIEGMRLARCERVIFRHNDAAHLEEILRQFPRERPKIIAFESVYSMEGDFAPIHSICDLARKYQAFTYLDETHAVGLYGLKGGGVAQEIQATQRIDVIQGGLGKGYGTIGGFVAASQLIIDTIRSFGPGFIFTTALPPHCAAAATHSVRWLSHSSEERALHREVVASTKEALRKRQIPFHDGGTHIIPIQVGDSRLCQAMADYLLFERGIYIQPINYPTVPRGTERLRVTPTPFHTPEMIEALCEALAAARGEAVASRMVA
jgi:5-aminolevulinate synthase